MSPNKVEAHNTYSAKGHSDNCKSHTDVLPLKFSIAQSNGATLLKIRPNNTTYSALDKHV